MCNRGIQSGPSLLPRTMAMIEKSCWSLLTLTKEPMGGLSVVKIDAPPNEIFSVTVISLPMTVRVSSSVSIMRLTGIGKRE